MQKYKFELNIDDNLLTGDICINSMQKSPVCIILHGFKGHKDWGFIPYLSKKIAEKNVIAVKYNFSLNGYDKADKSLINIDKFKTMTITKQLQELDLVISKIKDNTLSSDVDFGKLWNGEVFLCGHSMGGAVTILYSSIYSGISKLILLASISKFDRYTDRQKQIWHKQGFIEFPNNKTGQMLRLNESFLDDFEKKADKYNIPNAISKLNIPILLIHGRQDVTVSMKEPEELIDAANKNNLEIKIIENAGHTFNVENKGITNNEILAEISNLIQEFIN